MADEDMSAADRQNQEDIKNVAIVWSITVVAGLTAFFTGAWFACLCGALIAWPFAKEIEITFPKELAAIKAGLFRCFDAVYERMATTWFGRLLDFSVAPTNELAFDSGLPPVVVNNEIEMTTLPLSTSRVWKGLQLSKEATRAQAKSAYSTSPTSGTTESSPSSGYSSEIGSPTTPVHSSFDTVQPVESSALRARAMTV